MNDDDNKRKYFDIAPPPKIPPKNIVNPDDRPSGSVSPDESNSNEFADSAEKPSVDNTLMDPEEANESDNAAVSHQASTVEPLSNAVMANSQEANDNMPNAEVADQPDLSSDSQNSSMQEPSTADETTKPNVSDSNKPDETTAAKRVEIIPPPSPEPTPELEPKAQPEDKDVPAPAERFSVTDSLPDPGEKAAATAKADMQDPKPYDTKQYYVPIGNAHHKHGHVKGAFVFGIFCAVIVVGIVVFVMWQIGR